MTLTRVKGICYKVVDVSLGPTHTAVLTESGHVVTFGRNAEGQLGRGHLRSSSSGPRMVKSMADRIATVSSSLKCKPSGFRTWKRTQTQWLKSIPFPLLTA